jgi:hypothetical protein
MNRHALAIAISITLISTLACTQTVSDGAVEEDERNSIGDDPTCNIDADCDPEFLCVVGACIVMQEEGCTTKAECGQGLVCNAGDCVAPPDTCGTSEDCPDTLVCDGFSRACIDPNATGCQLDSECALEPGCEDGCACDNSGACVAVDPVDPDPTDPDPVDPDPVDPDPVDPDPVDPPTGGTLDLGGFILENREHDPPVQVGVLPEGTTLEPGQRLIIARNAARSAFENHWGVDLGSDVVFLNAETGNSGVPIINGGEAWCVTSPVGTALDDVTIAGGNGSGYTRLSTTSADNPASWLEQDAADVTPGSASLPSSGVGLVVSGWSDAPGTGNYVFEFVELYYAP